MPPSRLRYPAARDVFEAFPGLHHVLPAPPDDSRSLDFAQALAASPSPAEAVIFLAHLLPKRDAVSWAIRCVRAALGEAAEDDATRAATGWADNPEDGTRRAALAAYDGRDQRRATTWLAYAAGWSGGSVTPPDQDSMPAPPQACAAGVQTAVILAACAGEPGGAVGRLRACALAGVDVAHGGDIPVRL